MTRRLLAAFLGLILLVLVVLIVPLGFSFERRERDDLIARVERDTVAIAFFVEDDLDPDAPDVVHDLAGVAAGYADRTGGRVVIVDAQGVALADSSPPDATTAGVGRDFSSRPEVAQALAGTVARGTRHSDTLGTGLVYVAVPVASGGTIDGAVRITYPTTEADRRVRRAWMALGGLAAVTIAAAAIAATVLAASVTRPLRRLRVAAGHLGDGQLEARAATDSGPPEVQQLARAFNQMAARLEDLVSAQEQFVHDASHELRTPLTALRLRLEMLPSSSDTGAALEEVARMARLVDGLLALARADGPEVGPRTQIDVAAFFEERREAWEPVAGEGGVTIDVAVRPGTTVTATVDRLVQIVDNLVANALDVAPEGSTVRLVAAQAGGRVTLHVIDQGPGLSPEERSRAFDRFWRGGTSRGRFGGSGIGLAIVHKLALAEGAEAELLEAPGGGIDAVVRLPADDD